MLLGSSVPVVVRLALGVIAAQAEEAPEEPAAAPAPSVPAPQPVASKPVALNATLGLVAGVGRRLGRGADNVSPPTGFALHAFGRKAYAQRGPLALEVEMGFSFERYWRNAVADPAFENADQTTSDEIHSFNYFDFSVAQLVTATVGPVQPFVGAGVGVVFGHFRTIESAYAPGEQRATRPLVLAAAGVAVDVTSSLQLGLRGSYTWMAWAPDMRLDNGTRIAALGARAAVGLSASYRF